jgi:hypothetical protein
LNKAKRLNGGAAAPVERSATGVIERKSCRNEGVAK